MEQFQEAIISGALTILTAVLSIVAQQVVAYLKKKGALTLINQHKELATLAVQMVEQVYVDLHGEEKKAKAIEALSAALTEKGIKVSPEEIQMQIESAVKAMNDAVKQV